MFRFLGPIGFLQLPSIHSSIQLYIFLASFIKYLPYAKPWVKHKGYKSEEDKHVLYCQKAYSFLWKDHEIESTLFFMHFQWLFIDSHISLEDLTLNPCTVDWVYVIFLSVPAYSKPVAEVEMLSLFQELPAVYL